MGIQFLPITGLSKETAQAKTATANIEAYGLATLCWLLSAGVYIAAKAVATEMPPWTLCFLPAKGIFMLLSMPVLVLLLIGGVILALPFYIWEIIHDERTALNAKGILTLSYGVGTGGALMYYLFNRGVEALGASKAGVFL